MRHFDYLPDSERDRWFFRAPEPFGPDADPELLAMALGATLYSPATRATLAADIAKQAARGVMSSVVCLEDAISDADLPMAERNAVAQLREYAATGAEGPLLFVRVRTPAQIPMIVDGLGDRVSVLTGFVLPKFTAASDSFLQQVQAASERTGRRLLVMPVLESPEIIYSESRTAALMEGRALLESYREHVLAVRVGATDLSSAYGLRRPRDLTVWDVRIVADVLADIVNVFARADGSGYLVSGAVWEYFSGTERLFKPQLRESPFTEHDERALRVELLADDLDGLIREVALDKANGITGKTVIHPTHVAAVHALSVVTHEEYSDALDIAGTDGGGGVAASTYKNKMNESKPHRAWAARTLLRARVFGVAHRGTSFVDLLGAGMHQ